MTSHINTLAKDEKKEELSFGCEYCKKRFNTSKDLTEHLASHPEARAKSDD